MSIQLVSSTSTMAAPTNNTSILEERKSWAAWIGNPPNPQCNGQPASGKTEIKDNSCIEWSPATDSVSLYFGSELDEINAVDVYDTVNCAGKPWTTIAKQTKKNWNHGVCEVLNGSGSKFKAIKQQYDSGSSERFEWFGLFYFFGF